MAVSQSTPIDVPASTSPGQIAVVGVDPGGRSTGICARGNDVVLVSVLIPRPGRDPLPRSADLRRVVVIIEAVCRQLRAAGWTPHVAVEDVVAPNPHLGMSNPVGLLGTAMVLGAVLSRWPGAAIVAPKGHGSAPLAAYPTELVGPTETAGTGKRRHLRSAWDIAGAAEMEIATTSASKA
jgi:hypothetical protein